ACVGVYAEVGVADFCEFCDVGAHERRTQGAVQADGDGSCVPDGVPEGFDGLARQDAAGGVSDCAGDHDGQAYAAFFEYGFYGKDGSFGVEGVKDGFDQHQVDATVQQAFELFGVSIAQFVEGDVAGCGVVDVGRDGGGFGLWA